ncbi:MAG: putative protein CapI, partial [Streblomastix strix]
MIGSWLITVLLKCGANVVAIDSWNDYYQCSIKMHSIGRLDEISRSCGNRLVKKMGKDYNSLSQKVSSALQDMAARAGVRPSMLEPDLFYSENVLGTENVFRLGIELNTQNIVFASSSAVYGKMKDGICSETLELAPPESFYGETKVLNEKYAADLGRKMKQQLEQQQQQQSQQQPQPQSQSTSQYSPPHSISLTGLRFFTCNGPMLGCSDIGRPDMAISQFVSMLRSKGERVLTMYGDGEFKRDYTFVFDVVEGICLSVISGINRQKVNDCELKIYNIGEDHTSSVKKIIVLL